MLTGTNIITAAFICLFTRVHDGDGPLWCQNGIKVRMAGVQATDFENAEPCRRGKTAYVCSDDWAPRGQRIVERLTLHRSMTCQPAGKLYQRVVARRTLPDGRSLSYAVIAAGADTRWDSYWRRYRTGECR